MNRSLKDGGLKDGGMLDGGLTDGWFMGSIFMNRRRIDEQMDGGLLIKGLGT